MPKVRKTTTRKAAAASPYGSTKSASSSSKEDAKSTTKKTTSKKKLDTKETPRVPNYLFYCAMVCSDNPTISRHVSVPSNFTFEVLHVIMQIAFGWAGSHMWHFRVHKMFESMKEQREWEDEHALGPLFMIMNDPESMRSAMPDQTYKDAAEWTLADLFGNEEYRSKVEMYYEYDFGDGWEHHITFAGDEDPGFRKALMADVEYDHPLCFGGEGHPCAEDSGGSRGWEAVQKAFKGGRDNELKRWYKTICSNGDPKGFDPYRWSVLEVNDDLQMFKKK